MNDPFFAAQKRAKGPKYGQHTDYVTDLYSTYNGLKGLPTRDPEMFSRALQFREKEKAAMRATEKRCHELAEQLKQERAMLSRAHTFINKLNTQFSSIQQRYERSDDSADRGSRRDGVQALPVSGAGVGLHSAETDKERPNRNGGDVHRHADEHSRKSRDGDGGESQLSDNRAAPVESIPEVRERGSEELGSEHVCEDGM